MKHTLRTKHKQINNLGHITSLLGKEMESKIKDELKWRLLHQTWGQIYINMCKIHTHMEETEYWYKP